MHLGDPRPALLAFLIRFLTGASARPRRQRQVIAMAIDAVTCIAAVWIAWSLRVGEWQLAEPAVLLFAGVALVIWYPIAWRMGVYLAIIRYSGGRTMMGLAMACGVFAIPMVAVFMFWGIEGVPRTMGLLHPILFLSLLAVSRLAMRFALIDILQMTRGPRGGSRVLIYGAGSAGQQLALSLRHEAHITPVGFLDDDLRLEGQRLNGVPVFGTSRLDRVIDGKAVDEVLLALPSVSRSRRRAIVDQLQASGVRVRSLPSLTHVIQGQVTVNDLREVQIEDLLGREPIAPNELLMARTLTGKTVLISGAGGSIGSELCRQIIRSRPKRMILVEQSEYALYAIEGELIALIEAEGLSCEIVAELADVADRGTVMRVYDRLRPDTVFHAAAYKHVPLVEANPLAGLRNNVMGTWYSTMAAERAGVATFILVSTDKAVRPTNVMGASKRVCELILQARAAQASTTVFTMVRFGNVLGSSGSVVPRFKSQIAAGGPVTITHRDVTRYFMTMPEASQLVIQAGAMAQGGEVFVLDMGQPVRIVDLAATLIRLSGLTVRDATRPDGDIEIVEVGLRPGEKLYEELLIGDDPQPTRHARIMRARESMLPLDRLTVLIGQLEDILNNGNAADALVLLRTLVPEWTAGGAAGSRADVVGKVDDLTA